MTDVLRDRLQAMNPEPLGDSSPDELAAVFAVIEARRSTMTVNVTFADGTPSSYMKTVPA